MRREQLTEKVLGIKRARSWSWKYIAGEIGGMSPVLVVGALLRQMSGKFLPYKYYGNEPGVPAYGYKEE